MRPSIPDYFLALNKQYGLAINDDQAQNHVRSVIKAWYLTLPKQKQAKLVANLPKYLAPKQKLFFHRTEDSSKIEQAEVMFSRLAAELQKTDIAEVRTVITGVFKSLKIVSDHQQKFELSNLLDQKLLAIFVEV